MVGRSLPCTTTRIWTRSCNTYSIWREWTWAIITICFSILFICLLRVESTHYHKHIIQLQSTQNLQSLCSIIPHIPIFILQQFIHLRCNHILYIFWKKRSQICNNSATNETKIRYSILYIISCSIIHIHFRHNGIDHLLTTMILRNGTNHSLVRI